MNILFIHQNFPGQFKHLAPELARRGHKVTALFPTRDVGNSWRQVELKLYEISRVNSKEVHPWALDFETKVIRAEACYRRARELAKEGYQPEIIIAHPGWGESLFLKHVWPNAQLGIYCEFYYHPSGVDVGFDQEFPMPDPGKLCNVQLKNANILLHAEEADSAISPTHWQASLFPKHLQDKITIIHDGIDTKIAAPDPRAQVRLPNERVITKSDQVITFVNRSLEPHRGFHTFMRSLPKILNAQSDVEILIVGDDGVSYGPSPSDGRTWKEVFSEEVFPDLNDDQKSHIHFLGRIAYEQYLSVLQVSTVHVYLTYPFVLSWSLLEAMSVGCSIVASDTPPLHEAIEHKVNGILVNFFSPQELADSVISLLDSPKEQFRLGRAARELARTNYDLQTICLPRQIEWVEKLNNHGA